MINWQIFDKLANFQEILFNNFCCYLLVIVTLIFSTRPREFQGIYPKPSQSSSRPTFGWVDKPLSIAIC